MTFGVVSSGNTPEDAVRVMRAIDHSVDWSGIVVVTLPPEGQRHVRDADAICAQVGRGILQIRLVTYLQAIELRPRCHVHDLFGHADSVLAPRLNSEAREVDAYRVGRELHNVAESDGKLPHRGGR